MTNPKNLKEIVKICNEETGWKENQDDEFNKGELWGINRLYSESRQESIKWVKEIRYIHKFLEEYDKDAIKELLRESLHSNSIVKFITDDDTYNVRCGMRNRLLGMEKAFMDFFNLTEEDFNG